MTTPDPQLQTRLYQILGIIEQQQAQSTKLLRKLESYSGLERQIATQAIAAVQPTLKQEFQSHLAEQHRHMQKIREEFDTLHQDRHLLWESKRQRTYLIFILIGMILGAILMSGVFMTFGIGNKLSDISQRVNAIEQKQP